MIKGDLQNKMSLQEYDKKRDFARTPEPAGNVEQQKKKREQTRRTSNLRFVVQKHEARRLHYDFRLETNDGTLKSWAVPKSVSIYPKEKRLAVLTEDHPLDYLLFGGVIPKGNYGAATVIVWDTGTYTILNEGPSSTYTILNEGPSSYSDKRKVPGILRL
jgi:bifunctional non-homologous end joining protein LigD